MKNTLLAVLALGFTAACGGLSEDDVSEALMAMQTVSNQGRTQAGALTNAQAVADFSMDCPNGGSAAFSGALDGTAGVSAGSMSFDFDVTFTACASGGHTVDGGWSFVGDASASGSTAGVNLHWFSNGSITIDEETCDSIDMIYNVSASYSGTGLGGLSANIGFSGTACGYDVADDLSFSGAF